jgi:hypothetical protein
MSAFISSLLRIFLGIRGSFFFSSIPINDEHIIFFISLEFFSNNFFFVLQIDYWLYSLHSSLYHLFGGDYLLHLFLQRHLYFFFLLQNPTP